MTKLEKLMIDYYLPQLKHSMKSHRDFAEEHKDKEKISSLHNGAANAYEVCIGCIEEAIKDSRKSKSRN